MLKRAFLGWLRGEPDHCTMAAAPTLEEEDARRPNRERESLVGERTRVVNRMKATLARLGIRGFKPTLRDAVCPAGSGPRRRARPHPGRRPARASASCRRSSGTLGESRGGVSPIGVKIALDPARVGTILGRCKTQHLSRRINLKSCCGDFPPLSILTASPDKPRRSSAGVRSTVALTCCAWRWPAALVACR